ncbi:hypothetical protein Q7Z90_07505 [Glaesserella parasuis]|uniref:hypothetical protein n=1 Tax=Glaesserella parasuis TaxID=738 RepID=UPI0018E2F327|nr:hypothetical protein [Glaesserella parasuis]MDP0328655.1 hypothetical protein [Glaesserella parasuis]MDP0391257.1 hypothetical protein [Glaesserella parasuis]
MYQYKITILPSLEGKKENSFPPLAGEGARRADGGELNILFRPHPLRFTKGLPPFMGEELILLSKNQCHTLEIKNPTFRWAFD